MKKGQICGSLEKSIQERPAIYMKPTTPPRSNTDQH